MDLFLELSPAEDSSESPHCSLDHNIAHILNLLDSPSEQPRGGDTLSDDNNDVPDTQPISGQILKDVVAYVEARSGNDNRSGAISRELELLGATVERKFTNDVTHVVFKAGSKMTQERARKRGIHLVSVLWVDSCKQNLKHMSELLFPVVPADTLRTPVFVGRLKKLKSMQPKDFEDDVASSADRGQKRRRRQLHADKWKVLETPGAGLLQGAAHAYVEETQPRSPTDTTPLPHLTVPDTPPSMREKLNSLRRKRLSLQHSAECGTTTELTGVKENEPLQRRLFGLPEGDTSPQPRVATPETEAATAKDVSGDLTKMNECNAVGQEAEEEDPIPVHLVGSSTVCVPNRRHRLLPLNQEPFNELLQPVYTDQWRRPGQNHFFPEIASQNPRKTKQKGGIKGRDGVSSGDAVKSRAEGKGAGKKSGKRKNGSSRQSGGRSSQEEDRSRKRRRKGTVEETEGSLSVAGLTCSVQDVTAVDGTTSSRRHCQLQAGDSQAVNTDFRVQAKVLNVSDNGVCSTTGDEVRLLDIPSNSHVTVDNRCDNSLQSTNVSRTNLTKLASNNGKCSRPVSGDKVEETEIHETKGKRGKPYKRVTKMSVEAMSPTEDADTPGTSQTDKNRHSARGDQSSPGSSNGVDKARTVARRQSVRLQRHELHKPSSNPPTHGRQTGQDSSSTDISSSDLSVNQSRGTQLSPSSSLQRSCLLLNFARSNRKSIDEFAVVSSQRRPLVKSPKKDTSCKENIKSGNNSMCVGVGRKVKSVGSHSSKRDHSVSKQPNISRKSGPSCGRNSSVNGGNMCDTSNWKKVIIAENRKSHEHLSKTLVMTSLHTDEQDMVRSVVKKLGGYRIASAVSETTTHVICGNDRRTLNVLLGICRGSWLLSLEWVFKSLECNRWLDEEPYEQSDFFPAAQISRLERLTASGNYTQDLFSKHSPVCVAPHTVPSRTDLVKLIKLCAGQVTQCLSKCTVCVGKVPQEPGVISVSEQWVLDSITAHRALPHKEYRLDGDGGMTRGDSSPEY